MKLVLGNSSEILNINSDVTDVHLTFRPSEKWIFKLMDACPDLQSIQIPPAYAKSISATTKLILESKGIYLHEGKVQNTEKYVK